MKRHHLAGLAALTLGLSVTLAANDASAQTPNQPPSSPPASTPTSPPPSAAAPTAPAGAGGSVRLHVSTEKNKGVARLYINRKDGYQLVCSTPCTADVPVNSEMRVTLNNNDDEPHSFTVPGDMGPELDVRVKAASLGPLIGGIVAMGAGGAFVLSGLLFIALADLNKSTRTSSTSSSINKDVSDTYKVTGYVCIGIGAAAAVVGLIVLTTRSKEPRLDAGPYGAPVIPGRQDTLLGDLASLKPRDPTFVQPAITPLTYTIRF